MIRLVYFSTKSGNTHRFIERLGFSAHRLPLASGAATNGERLEDVSEHQDWMDNGVAQQPFVLVTPTYGGGHLKGAVPPQVIRFLNVEANRTLLQGVIACGDTNYGSGFCSAGRIIAEKCKVPHLYNIEVFGTPHDCEQVRERLIDFWKKVDSMVPPLETPSEHI